MIPVAHAVALWFAMLPAVAGATEVEPLLARLESASSHVETLAGEFTQKSRIKLFKQDLSSSGRLFFQRPRRIRWEYLRPDPSTLVLDGDRATLHAAGAAPQSFDLGRDTSMRAVFDQLTLWLGGGSLAQARNDYELAATGSPTLPSLLLTPRSGTPAARAFSRIELRFDERLVLRGIVLREVSGDEKEISFQKMERNVRLPKDAFNP